VKHKPSNPPPQFATWECEDGCYFDSARGVYLIDALVPFAESLGFVPSDCDCDSCKASGDYSACEFSNETEDEIDAYLNARFEIPGYSWGRNENGDWGLWKVEEDEDLEDTDN
jgi:hypothetical protein